MRTLFFLLLFTLAALAQQAPNSTPFSSIVPANTTGVLVISGAHNVTGIQFATIASATTVYFKMYDTGTAPTCGSGTPVKRLQIANGNISTNPWSVDIPVPIKFINGIGYCVTGAIGDTDTTPPLANQTVINIDWQ